MDLAQVALLIPVIVGISQVLKMAGVPSQYIPLVSIVLGGLGAMYFIGGPYNTAIFEGVIAALSANGLYSGTKATAGL